MSLEAFFLPTAGGRLFCLFHGPDDGTARKGAVIYVHPFAEEMNKSRRMAGLQAKAMASAGYAVLQVDLFGCGDSAGDFGEATWESWIANLIEAARWLRERSDAPLWWWGLRTGALLAVAAATRFGQPGRLLLWQPVMQGKQYLRQFLRLKIAGELLDGGAKGAMNRVKVQLADGVPVEIAGYMLSPALASGLEQAELTLPDGVQRVALIEIASGATVELSPVASARLAAWRVAGSEVRGVSVPGPAFWQTTEIEECPALIDASLRLLAEMDA
ncbi:MAG: hydrolase 2, exosortase A system-associated [Propionivibrio sp.]